ncbi:MAG TPA: Maf family nucleotide pyrophosphatase [Taishania sp.]|nr:Maf family nucleotide pyrophosphatase [Taishania sp.]
MKIILGSNSPRRKQLLQEMGYDFEVRVADTDESFPKNLSLSEVAMHVAKNKAIALAGELEADEVLITADTIVCVDEQILGKPKDKTEATMMLRLLSGKSHLVITGVCLVKNGLISTESCTTKVIFKELSDQEISYYIDNYKPFDKAGSYGIQEWIGAIGIVAIEGSYNNVVGLPTHVIHKMLNK